MQVVQSKQGACIGQQAALNSSPYTEGSMSTSTWDCGTPRSTGNAFNVRPVTSDEVRKAEAIKQKHYDEYTRKLARRGLTRDDIKRKQAERKNPEASIDSFIPKSVRAPR